jgi:hypothetical protein
MVGRLLIGSLLVVAGTVLARSGLGRLRAPLDELPLRLRGPLPLRVWSGMTWDRREALNSLVVGALLVGAGLVVVATS